MNVDVTTSTPEFSEDLLTGARAIGKFVFGKDDNYARRKIYHLARTSRFPVFRLGSMLCARKSKMKEWVKVQEDR